MTTPTATIAICTCDRHDYLKQLLSTLAEMPDVQGAIVAVSDNGVLSAEALVKGFSDRFDLRFARVEERGLVPNRNNALRMAVDTGAEYIALIDDDEWPAPEWLSGLLETAQDTGADMVAGPVIVMDDGKLPKWLTDGGLLDSGTDYFGTGNLLIRTSALPANPDDWFKPAFSLIGGEDRDFLERMTNAGATVARNDAALAYEHVPPERRRFRYFWQRGLRGGAIQLEAFRARNSTGWGITREIIHRTVMNTGYTMDHFIRIPWGRWHFVRGSMDLACIIGIYMRLLGIEMRFYGAKGPKD